MTRPPHGPRQVRQYTDPNWQPPTRPSKNQPDRREPVPVDLLGRTRGRRTYEHLSPVEHARFDAQMAAWLAGCELARAYDHAWFGVIVPESTTATWESARDEWHFERVAGTGRGFAR